MRVDCVIQFVSQVAPSSKENDSETRLQERPSWVRRVDLADLRLAVWSGHASVPSVGAQERVQIVKTVALTHVKVH